MYDENIKSVEAADAEQRLMKKNFEHELHALRKEYEGKVISMHAIVLVLIIKSFFTFVSVIFHIIVTILLNSFCPAILTKRVFLNPQIWLMFC